MVAAKGRAGGLRSSSRELAALKERRERIEDLERDADALLEHYASMVPEALDNLTPEERHRVYKMMRINALMYADGLVEITGAFGGLLEVGSSNSVKTESTSSSTATSQTSPRRGTGSHTAWRRLTSAASCSRRSGSWATTLSE